ncbi:MAG: multiple sugar transport system ATP-binding protein [Gaiellaceae bacterium]|jgi:multiple sugar transport system ATP-binding protein|nr:multiple sugar transport system ATP-binding protein [Gaiellaceae bacterium]
MAEVRYDKATRMYAGTDAPAVNALDLHINEGEFVVLVGPSGSGKTTALRMLAGLEEVDAGTITIGDRDVTDLPPKQRDIAMVFQNYALYPYLSVEANIAFPLKIAKVPKAERNERVKQVAEMLGLTEYLHRKPGQLSGGQRQRVAMGRAMVRRPSVYLMDEPLSNLDAKLRVQMRSDIAALQLELGVTTVYVTHDQSEAMTLGNRVAALKDGFLQQFDTPDVLYRKPANLFVAGFIGSPAMNLFTLPSVDGGVSLCGVDIPLPPGVAQARSERKLTELVVGLRPESLELGSEGLPAQVTVVETIGFDAHVFCIADVGGKDVKLVARAEAKHAPTRGEQITLRPNAEEAHFFDPQSGEAL